MYLDIPLHINKNKLEGEKSVEQSINSFIYLLLTTPRNSCPSDPQFGFVFNNLRFEIFNENEGVVYNDADTLSKSIDNPNDLYAKKISGSSKNLNTFASEFKEAIAYYEKRLSNISVTMTYMRELKKIHVTVKGVITELSKDYLYSTDINVWN